MSGTKTESSGTTCANYFAKQFLAGIAKSFDRYDTGSIESLQLWYNAFYSNVAMSDIAIGQMDRCSLTTNCLTAVWMLKKKKKKKKERKNMKRFVIKQFYWTILFLMLLFDVIADTEAFHWRFSGTIDQIVQ